MKVLFSIFLCFQFLVLNAQWQKITNYDGRFQVEMPHQPTEKIDTIETGVGKTTHHTFYWQTEDAKEENQFFSLIYFDLPQEAITSDSTAFVEDFFNATIETATEAMRGKMMYKIYEELAGFPGYFWRIDYLEDKAVVKSKAWLVDNRFYELKVISWKSHSVNPDNERFFDSFKLLVPDRKK